MRRELSARINQGVRNQNARRQSRALRPSLEPIESRVLRTTAPLQSLHPVASKSTWARTARRNIPRIPQTLREAASTVRAEQISEVTVAQYDLSTLRSDLEAGAQIASVSLEVDGLHGGSPLGDGPVNVIAYATNSPPSTADLTAPGTLAGIITADEPSEVEDDDPELGHYSVDVTQAVEAVANASGMLDLRFQPGSDEWADMYLFNDPPGSELQRETELVVTFAAQQIYPTITPTLDGTPGGGASVDYTLTGTLPPAPEADIDLYWAPTQNFDSARRRPTPASRSSRHTTNRSPSPQANWARRRRVPSTSWPSPTPTMTSPTRTRPPSSRPSPMHKITL